MISNGGHLFTMCGQNIEVMCPLKKQKLHFLQTWLVLHQKSLTKLSFYHNESTFQSNDDQNTFWGKGTAIMKPT